MLHFALSTRTPITTLITIIRKNELWVIYMFFIDFFYMLTALVDKSDSTISPRWVSSAFICRYNQHSGLITKQLKQLANKLHHQNAVQPLKSFSTTKSSHQIMFNRLTYSINSSAYKGQTYVL